MGLFNKNRQVSTRADGARVTETKNKTRVSYPNGDIEVTDKKRGATVSHARIRPDGKRERDGK